MKKIILAALAAASCILGSNAALAAYVTVYANGVLLGSWTQSLTPMVLSTAPGSYTNVLISDGTGAAFGYTSARWYDDADHGGLLVGDLATSPINSGGPQSFIGTLAAPVFEPGAYVEVLGQTVTISVPEPATWAMMLVGFGMVGVAARRRRQVAVTYA